MKRGLLRSIPGREPENHPLGAIRRAGMAGIATARLRLRPPAKADIPHVQRYAMREDFYRYMDMERPTPEGVAKYLKDAIAAWERPAAAELVLAIEPEAGGRLAGLVRIRIEADEENCASVGFHLDRDFQGRGYASEALRETVRIGFDEAGLRRIRAEVDTRNRKSCRVLERAGLRLERRMEGFRSVRGTVTDWYLYALTPDSPDRR